jgi:hypothetical protein
MKKNSSTKITRSTDTPEQKRRFHALFLRAFGSAEQKRRPKKWFLARRLPRAGE